MSDLSPIVHVLSVVSFQTHKVLRRHLTTRAPISDCPIGAFSEEFLNAAKSRNVKRPKKPKHPSHVVPSSPLAACSQKTYCPALQRDTIVPFLRPQMNPHKVVHHFSESESSSLSSLFRNCGTDFHETLERWDKGPKNN